MKLLIVYQEMVLGGSTSNLLSLLNSLDYSRVHVDLLLRRNEGELLDSIPPEVNVLKPLIRIRNRFLYQLLLFSSPGVFLAKLKSRYLQKKKGFWFGLKYFENKDLEYTRDLPGEYDAAIGYLEGWTHTYIAGHVKAKKKIGYLHLDYKAAGLIPELDYDVFKQLDNIIFVSQKNKEVFDECFPDFKGKSMIMPHIFSQELIRRTARSGKSDIVLDHCFLNCVTVARIVFRHKGFDRVLRVLNAHKAEKCFERFRWYVIGDGPDFGRMKEMIAEYGLEDQVFMLGTKENAYANEVGMDIFLQPSYYEGKPAAVYEAMILGVPPLVTEYGSAREQIEDGKEGIIVENSEAGIYDGLTDVLSHPEKIARMKEYMKTKNYNNTEDVATFYKLVGETSCGELPL